MKEKKEGRFTTSELLRKIKTHREFPQDQMPVLSDREDVHARPGRIMLHPVQKEGSDTKTTSEIPDIEPHKKRTVTLHFDFLDKPTHEHLEIFGRGINGIFDRETLDVNRVRWGGMKRSTFARAAKRFHAPIKKRRASMRAQPGSLTRQVVLSSSSSNLLSPASADSAGFERQGSTDTSISESAMRSPPKSSDSNEEQQKGNQARRKRRKTFSNVNSTTKE